MDELASKGYEVLGNGEAKHCWPVRPPGYGRVLELRHAALGSPPRRFPVLRFYFADEQKFRKAKEIAADFEAGGLLWAMRHMPARGPFLACELPSLPAGDDLTLLLDVLETAIQLCTAPVKAARKPRSKVLKAS